MTDINHVIIKQGKVNIINRNFNFTACYFGCIKVFRIDNIGIQNTGKLFFQNFVCRNLQILINGQIYVIAGNRFMIIRRFRNLSDTVYKNSFIPLNSLKLGFHGFFNSKLSYRIIHIVIRIFCL